MVERLLEVEEGAGSVTGARGAEGGDPNIGGVEVAKEVGGVTGVDGRERGRCSEASALKPVVCVRPGGGERGKMCDLEFNEGVGEVHAPKVTRELSLSEHVIGERWKA